MTRAQNTEQRFLEMAVRMERKRVADMKVRCCSGFCSLGTRRGTPARTAASSSSRCPFCRRRIPAGNSCFNCVCVRGDCAECRWDFCTSLVRQRVLEEYVTAHMYMHCRAVERLTGIAQLIADVDPDAEAAVRICRRSLAFSLLSLYDTSGLFVCVRATLSCVIARLRIDRPFTIIWRALQLAAFLGGMPNRCVFVNHMPGVFVVLYSEGDCAGVWLSQCSGRHPNAPDGTSAPAAVVYIASFP